MQVHRLNVSQGALAAGIGVGSSQVLNGASVVPIPLARLRPRAQPGHVLAVEDERCPRVDILNNRHSLSSEPMKGPASCGGISNAPLCSGFCERSAALIWPHSMRAMHLQGTCLDKNFWRLPDKSCMLK